MKILLGICAVLLLMPSAYAQVSYYGIDNVINRDNSIDVKMTITFSEIIENFNFIFLGSINNFKAVSNAGPVDCNLESDAVTNVNCKLSLTQEKRNLEITFTTDSLVKGLGNLLFFDGDFNINKNMNSVFVSVKIPEGMILSSNNNTYPTLPIGSNTISDGRHIIVTWSLFNITHNSLPKFQLAYEPLSVAPSIPSYVYFIVGVIAAASVSFIIVRRMRKPKDVIFSVLDKYEKSVMDCVVNSGGTVNQKKIVQETNLSKAKVSRVIKNLVNRGLVESERLGRTSKIKVIKKGFGHF